MKSAVANPKVTEIRQSVQSSYRELTEMLNRLIAALEPAQLYLAPAPNEWSVMQSLAHIIEFMPYWANETTQLVARPGQNFGRVMTDPVRIKAISDHGQDSLETVHERLPGSYARLEEMLGLLQDSDLALTGVHSKFGEQTLEWFLAEFVTRHLQNHLRQLRECLAVVSS